jgi:hypothetical protein
VCYASHAHGVCRNKAFAIAIELDPAVLVLTLYTRLSYHQLTFEVFTWYLRPSGAKGHRSILTADSKRIYPTLGDRTNISRSTTVTLNSDYYVPHLLPPGSLTGITTTSVRVAASSE